jgi:hypothetical protein
MLLFPFYAALYWYLAGKYRRSWRGVFVIFAGMGGVAILEALLIRLGLMGIGGIEPWDLVRLIIPFGVLITLVAIFIFFIPYPPPAYVHCRRCKYELTGLDATDLLCPECGTPWTYPPRCPHCRCMLPPSASPSPCCPECRSLLVPQSLLHLPPYEPPGGAEKKDEHGKPGDEHPADESQGALTEVGNKRD